MTMRCRVLRGGRRIPGWGELREPGDEITVSAELARQLIAQGLVEPIAIDEIEETPPSEGGIEQETD